MSVACLACSIAWRRDAIGARLAAIADAGFDGIEAWGPHLDALDDAGLDALRADCARLGLSLPVVSPYFFLTRDLPDLLQRSFATAERAVRQARRLGAGRIRTFVDAGPDGIGSAIATPEQRARAADGLRRIAALAPDLLFTVETHPGTLADTAASTLRLLAEVGAANLAVLFQPRGDDAVAEYRLLRHAVRHVHLHQVRPGGGHDYLDAAPDLLAPFLAELRRDGYAGTASIEYCWPDADPGRLAGGLRWLRARL